MIRIRLHGRGGQGIKTASHILGSSLFFEGFEVQDAPRYGAERRGAPIFATVRASRKPIHERGVIRHPDLVVVADETLIPVAAAGVLQGMGERSVLLVRSDASPELWRERLCLAETVHTLPLDAGRNRELHLAGAACAGAAARLLGLVSRENLENAIREELAQMNPGVITANLACALEAWEHLTPHAGSVTGGVESDAGSGDESSQAAAIADGEVRLPWIDFPFEPATVSAPDVHGSGTSVQVRTGLWRTTRPVVEEERCRRCHWICSTFCPDGAIRPREDGVPSIDYDHCKGCLVCVAVCPSHAIHTVAETAVQETP